MAGTEFETIRTTTVTNGSEPRYEHMAVDELRRAVDCLRTCSDEELSNIPVVHQGDHLERGAVYFDLRHQERGEITAMANMIADIDNWLVPKERTDPSTWNRLVTR